MAVRGLGCPVRFTLTAGQKGDAPQAAALIEGLSAEVVMADTAYDADHLRQAIAAKGAIAVIPNNPSRALKYPLDKHLYAQRHLVECCFSKLKQFRRVATRFEKTARNYQAVVTLAAIILWMRKCPHHLEPENSGHLRSGAAPVGGISGVALVPMSPDGQGAELS
jgi:transposase